MNRFNPNISDITSREFVGADVRIGQETGDQEIGRDPEDGYCSNADNDS
jgi:hypothetical protein